MARQVGCTVQSDDLMAAKFTSVLCHCNDVRPFTEEAANAMQVDDLLANSGLTIVGNDAISAIEVKHQGYQLYPVPSDQVEQFQALQTAAAFVANELLGCASDSE